jgi:serine/threonine protein phosphatase 1
MPTGPPFSVDRLGRFEARTELADRNDSGRIYAVGDIHGCAGLLDQLTALIVEDSKDAEGPCTILYLGDYIDRGPNSKGVIERLLAPPAGFATVHLRGNHDQMLLDFLRKPSTFQTWRDLGAHETLMSYGVLPPRFEDRNLFRETRDRLLQALPAEHLNFLLKLEPSARIGGYFFAHAGVRPGVGLGNQSLEDLLWIRDEFLESSANFGMIIVHGHTPAERPVRRSNRIGLDTGAYATGRLTAAVLEGSDCRFLHT